MKRVWGFVFSVFFLLLVSANAFAQAGATAQISGVVKDASGGVLPGVTVTATQTDTGLKRDATTETDGSYSLLNLPPGPYRVEAMLQGFRSFQQTGIVLQVGASPTINVTMTIGAVAETITVQANASLVETKNLGVGQVMTNKQVLELPLNGRNTADLLALNDALETLAEVDPQKSRIVELRFFGGLTIEETAQVMGISTPSVERGWRGARRLSMP